MIIGFDFDKVFINYPPFVPGSLIDFLYKGRSHFRRKNGKDKLTYRFPGFIEQKLRTFSHAPVFRHPITKNIDALKKIVKKKKYKTYLVSSRFGFLRKRTEDLLEEKRLSQYFTGVHFNYNNMQPHEFKEQTIRKLKIDTYIDDDLELATYLSEKIPHLKVFWINGGKHKKNKVPKKIIAISDIDEFLEKYL